MQMLLVLFAQSCNLQFYICNGLVKRCEKMTACPKRKQEGEEGGNCKTCKTWTSKITQLGMRKHKKPKPTKHEQTNSLSLLIVTDSALTGVVLNVTGSHGRCKPDSRHLLRVSPRRSVYEFACENIDASLPALPIQEPGAFLGDKWRGVGVSLWIECGQLLSCFATELFSKVTPLSLRGARSWALPIVCPGWWEPTDLLPCSAILPRLSLDLPLLLHPSNTF